MKSISLADCPLDLAATLNSGQAFHWRAEGAGWVGAIGDQPAYLEQRGTVLRFSGASPDSVRRYLALDHSLAEIIRAFPADDERLSAAVSFAPGLRILRQARWECLASFITSSLKQVAHISQISHKLRERFGRSLAWDGPAIWAYPSPKALAEAGENALRACGLGYRAKSLWLAAKALADGELDLETIALLTDEKALRALCQLHGVGDKIAKCVLLFAYERLASFPIDVWVERVLNEAYAPAGSKKWSRAEMITWASEHFGPYAGYAQQYLFHHARRGPKLQAAIGSN